MISYEWACAASGQPEPVNLGSVVNVAFRSIPPRAVVLGPRRDLGGSAAGVILSLLSQRKPPIRPVLTPDDDEKVALAVRVM